MNIEQYGYILGVDFEESQAGEIVRTIRNNLLAQSDWTQIADSPLSEANKTLWADYRQQLRDITETYAGNLVNTIFPAKPTGGN